MSDVPTFYQAITSLPRDIEEKLLCFNILQLCALVSEKTGPRWSGASDRYGPIQEIEKRWDLEALKKRIADIEPEEPLRTYARIMTALGGNPSREVVQDKKGAAQRDQDMRDKYAKHTEVKEKIAAKLKPVDNDVVRMGLETCTSLDDLKRVAGEQSLNHLDWVKIDGLANFGLKRMYVGNQWRTKIRREAKA